MKISRLGATCFKISFPGKNRTRINVLIDPVNGLKKSDSDTDIVLLAENKEKMDKISKNAFLIEGPGEYEIKGVFVQGIRARQNKTNGSRFYIIEMERMRICYLGDLDQKEFTTQQLEKIGPVHILIFPIKQTLTAGEMQKIVNQLEPNIVIPVEPDTKALKVKLKEFLNKMGVKDIEHEKQIVLMQKDLREEEMKIIILKTI